MADTRKYLVWSNEQRAWRRSNRRGYTLNFQVAGRYSRAEAISIACGGHGGWQPGEAPPDIAVPEEDLLAACAASPTPSVPE